jgi:predicted nicotinamide N-methyase
MFGYQTRKLNVNVGTYQVRIRALSDHMQYSDPNGHAEKVGICSASWSLFGQLWPASHVLAKAVKRIEIKDRYILELGCGLGLPSLVLQYRGANITASDHHPLSQSFLNYNTTLNKLAPIPYLDLPWANREENLTRFDLIIGSDILYEPDHSQLLVGLIERIAAPAAKVLISCPGRGYRNQFSRSLADLGFALTTTPTAFAANEKAPFRGQLLTYRRNQ